MAAEDADGQRPGPSNPTMANVPLYHTKKCCIAIVGTRLGVRTSIDASCQTLEEINFQNNPEEREELETRTKCPICLDNFNEEKKLLVTKCGHCICSSCEKMLSKKGHLICPLCRASLNGDHRVIKMNCSSFAVLAKSERKRLKKNIETIPKPELLALLEISKELLDFHKKRMKFLTLPSGLARKSFGQKIPEILSALNSQMIDSKLDRLGRGLKKVLKALDVILQQIDNAPDNVEFDLSGFLEKSVIQATLKKKKS